MAISVSTGSLDIPNLVSTFMTAEKAPLTAANKEKAAVTTKISNLGKVMSLSDAMDTKAKSLAKASTMTKDNLKTAVSDFVKAYNSLTSEAKNLTAKGANLQGESAVSSISSKLRGTTWMDSSVGSISSLKDVGITVSKEGVMSFDESTFNTKFDAAESDVKAVFANLGTKVDNVSGSDSSVGKFVQQRQEGYTARQKRLDDKIERVNSQLAKKETQYYNTFIALQKSMNSTSTNYTLNALSAYTNNNNNS